MKLYICYAAGGTVCISNTCTGYVCDLSRNGVSRRFTGAIENRQRLSVGARSAVKIDKRRGTLANAGIACLHKGTSAGEGGQGSPGYPRTPERSRNRFPRPQRLRPLEAEDDPFPRSLLRVPCWPRGAAAPPGWWSWPEPPRPPRPFITIAVTMTVFGAAPSSHVDGRAEDGPEGQHQAKDGGIQIILLRVVGYGDDEAYS